MQLQLHRLSSWHCKGKLSFLCSYIIKLCVKLKWFTEKETIKLYKDS